MPIDSPNKLNESSNASSSDLKIDETMSENYGKSDVCTTEKVTESKQVSSADANKTNVSNEETTNENNNNINNVPKARDVSNGKKSTTPTPIPSCGWCHDERKDLNFILPTLSGDSLKFCSEVCIVEFRKVVTKGACKQCGNAIRSMLAPNREYCSTFCWNKAKPTNGRTLSDFESNYLLK